MMLMISNTSSNGTNIYTNSNNGDVIDRKFLFRLVLLLWMEMKI